MEIFYIKRMMLLICAALFAPSARALDAEALKEFERGLKNDDVDVQRKTLDKMSELDAEAAPFAKMLTFFLKLNYDDRADKAAVVLGNIGPKAEAAIEELTRTLKTQDRILRGSVAYALGRIGPAAKSALPQLKEACDRSRDSEKPEYTCAIAKIEGNEVPFQHHYLAKDFKGTATVNGKVVSNNTFLKGSPVPKDFTLAESAKPKPDEKKTDKVPDEGGK